MARVRASDSPFAPSCDVSQGATYHTAFVTRSIAMPLVHMIQLVSDAGQPQFPERLPVSRLLDVLPVEQPDRALPYGGRVQILSVERYDARVVVNWRLAPIPDAVDQHERAMAVHERATGGLSDQERRARWDELVRRLLSPGLWVDLSDDIGTTYRSCSGGSHGGGQEKIGRMDFVPAVPEAASVLTVHWGNVEFAVRLP